MQTLAAIHDIFMKLTVNVNETHHRNPNFLHIQPLNIHWDSQI